MHDPITVAARLVAREAECPVRITSHRQIAIHPGALVVVPILMNGEDYAVHAVAVGRLGEPARLFTVPDPRDRVMDFRLLARFGAILESAFADALAADSYPQIWVSSPAAAALLDLLAERVRYTQKDPQVRRLGELLSFATDRYHLAGQQCLHTAVGALATHWATGQDSVEDAHLGVFLTWFRRPEYLTLDAAIERAEQQPAGIHPLPADDEAIFVPLLRTYNNARRRMGVPSALRAYGKPIRNALRQTALPIYDMVQDAIALLTDLPDGLPCLQHLEQAEADAFAKYMARANQIDGSQGLRLARRDKVVSATVKLLEREAREEACDAARLLEDRVERARGRRDGRVLCGTVATAQRVRTGPHQFDHRFTLLIPPGITRVRVRDTMHVIDASGQPTLYVEVTAILQQGAVTEIELLIRTGMQKFGLPGKGDALELVERVPDWDALRFRAPTVWKRLNAGLQRPPPVVQPATIPAADPMSLLEALR